MTDITFLKALRDKLKGGNTRSIHLNVLPGRFANRLDLYSLESIKPGTSQLFLQNLLTKSAFEFTLSFDGIDLNTISLEEQKKIGVLAKRLNSLHFENEDYFKEHGTKTFGFGYPIIVKRSKKDLSKLIKAPLFIWPLEIAKSLSKVNTWSILRNKVKNENGKIVDEDLHSVGVNEVLASFIQNDEGITIPEINEDFLEDALLTGTELVEACYAVLRSLNAVTDNTMNSLNEKFESAIDGLPDNAHFESISGNNNAWIHFGGVFGLFRTQKESIITDIDRLIERFYEFQFENLKLDPLTGSSVTGVATDPSQQQILNSLSSAPNKIIQGPPGTGKSQSLTALITNALANGLKCLVVCEKKTALDVIKINLHRENESVGQLAAIIEDISKDREAIVNSVRDRIAINNNAGTSTDARFEATKAGIEKNISQVNEEHQKLDRIIFKGRNWTGLTGDFLKKKKTADPALLMKKLHRAEFEFDEEGKELDGIVVKLKAGEKLYRQIKGINHGLTHLYDSTFKHDNVRAAYLELEEKVEKLNILLTECNTDADAIEARSREWADKGLPLHHQVLESVGKEYLRLVDGSILEDEERIPEQFAIENDLSNAINTLTKLKTRAQEVTLLYSDWLKNHYSDYYEGVKTACKKFQGASEENKSEFGEIFFKNTDWARLQINLFGLFIKKYRKIIVLREDFLLQYEVIKEVHGKLDYIKHDYYELAEDTHLEELTKNIRLLDETTEKWYSGTNMVIADYLGKFSSSGLHNHYVENTAAIQQIEDEITGYIGVLENRGLINGFSQPPLTISEWMGVINNAIQQLHQIKNDAGNLRLELNGLLKYRNVLEDKQLEVLDFNKRAELLKNDYELSSSISKLRKDNGKMAENLQTLLSGFDGFRDFYEWKQFGFTLDSREEKVVDALTEMDASDWAEIFESWYYFWIMARHEVEYKNGPQMDIKIQELFSLENELKDSEGRNIIRLWNNKQSQSLQRWLHAGMNPNSIFNKRGARGERRNSLRKIIKYDFGFFSDFFPVLLVSPSVCSSILPLEEGIFDLVIFDEASQLRLEDTFPALVRGKYKVISGDSQQMPPSAYFQGGNGVINPEESDEDEEIEFNEAVQDTRAGKSQALDLADSESLLMYAENSNYKQSFLKVHYRSQHPGLIDFSNHAFYGKRLIPMPAKEQYIPIKFMDIAGQYDEQVNRDEARKVIEILINEIEPLSNGKYPSVGIATFNLYQRNLISEEIINVRLLNPAYDKKINDLGPQLFVKNLENIQGDERDIIILSTTFGRKKDGTFRQNFGPIVQKRGYKLLNVIITRAKVKIFVVTSIPQEMINSWGVLLQQKGNNGRGVFYAYLAYAKAIHDGNVDLKDSILTQLYTYCENKRFDAELDALGSESPFEEEVFYEISKRIGPGRLEQQYKIGGFRIDLVVKNPDTGVPVIAIECDGAKYHSSNEAYAWDMFRQNQLEKYGLKFYRIWSTNWWNYAEKEINKVVEFIYETDRGINVQELLEIDRLLDVDADVWEPSPLNSDSVVEANSIVTVRAEERIFKMRFSEQGTKAVKSGISDCVIVPLNSMIWEALMGRKVGDICKLGALDKYYEVMEIE